MYMSKFCGKCGFKLNENGFCPNCDYTKIAIQNVQDKKTDSVQMQRLKQNSGSGNDTYRFHENKDNTYCMTPKELTLQEKKVKKIEDKVVAKAEKIAEKTTGQKVVGFFLKLLIIILVLVILISSATCALVYFNVLDIPFVSSVLNTIGIKNEEEDKIETLPTEGSIITSSSNTKITVMGVIYADESDNTLIKDAIVVFVKQGEKKPYKTVKSDADGNFEEEIEKGVYTITVSCEGYNDYTQKITVEGESVLHVNGILLSKISSYKKANGFLNINGKYVYSNGKGIYSGTSISDVNLIADIKNTGKIMSDGQTIYFTVDNGKNSINESHNQYDVYSVKYDGSSFKKVTSGNFEIELVTFFDDCLYYIDDVAEENVTVTYLGRLMKYNTQSGQTECISDDYAAAAAYFQAGKIYFSNALLAVESIDRSSVYAVDLKTEEITEVMTNSTMAKPSYLCSDETLYFESFDYNQEEANTENNVLYAIDKNGSLSKSLQIPEDKYLKYINYNDSFAILQQAKEGNGFKYYKVDLNSGEVTDIVDETSSYCDIIHDAVKPEDIYFIQYPFNSAVNDFSVSVYKLSGDRLIACSFDGESYTTIESGDYFIADGKFIDDDIN